MLINDSVTVVTEISAYLTTHDLAHCRRHAFELDFQANIITGHLSLLRVRNGYIHVLGYKPGAKKENHAHVQLTIYALALSRRCELPVKNFKCAWFDEFDYFEFFPLRAVLPA